ncbi:MAG: hypothetical protein Q9165_008391, partial [Trypethelium subeluteriae]
MSPASPVVTSETDLESGSIGKDTIKPKQASKIKSRYAATCAATWANLLGIFDGSISLFEHPSFNGDASSLIFCDTEYIPGDILAAPATGSVETIVTLAALAGCDEISFPENSVYPLARGPNLQLTFREHPQLGAIAVFQMFPGLQMFHL